MSERNRLAGQAMGGAPQICPDTPSPAPVQAPIAPHGFETELREYREQKRRLGVMGAANPFFLAHDPPGRAGFHKGTAVIGGREYLNFSNYDYLGLNGDPAVAAAADAAIAAYGTSVSASRIVSGERPIQRALELALAETLGTEDCVAMVSGYLTNLTTIGHLFGPSDVIFMDRLAHNSAMQGAALSRARRISFPHNDWRALDRLMAAHRGAYRKALIFVEGVYSMDGDIADVPRFLELRDRYKAVLMVDEAHSLGVLGRSGGGVREHFGLHPRDVDLWMGTLSKALASCGGYIAAGGEMVDYLKYTVPGFMFSVGISPPAAASALAALDRMRQEPQRVERVRARARLFLEQARAHGLNTGNSGGSAIVPVIVGDSRRTIALAGALFARHIHVQPVLAPAVNEATARLRFFITADHDEAQIIQAVEAVAEEMARLS